MNIPIFSQEVELGIGDKIQANRSVAYLSPVSKYTPSTKMSKTLAAAIADDKILAALEDSDLYYMQSILVSTNINKNDDAFSQGAAWASRHTPTHKPFNFNHQEHQIKGHIIDTWAVDADYNLIGNETSVDKLPDFFHLLNASVLYRQWEDEELKECIEDIIAKIETDKAYCSMEALVYNFDYLLKSNEGNEYKIVARDRDSSFLSKHLRAYGGTGNYDNHRVYRLITSCKFTACGIVENPANDESVIFNSKDHFNFKNVGVLNIRAGLTDNKPNQKNNLMENKMSDVDKTVEKLEAKIQKLEDERLVNIEKAVKAEREKLEAQNQKLVDELKAQKDSHQTVSAEVAELKANSTELQKSLDQVTANLTEVTKERDELVSNLDEIKASQVKSARIGKLVEGGFDKESAEAKAEKFSNLSDEQFEDFSNDLISARKDMEKDKEKDKDKKNDKSMADKTEDVIDNIQANDEIDLSANTNTDDDLVEVRKSVASYFKASFNK